jgi:hypothetical protein
MVSMSTSIEGRSEKPELDLPKATSGELEKILGGEALQTVMLNKQDSERATIPQIPQTKQQEKAMWGHIEDLYGRQETSQMKRWVKTGFAGVRQVEAIETRLHL